MALLNLGAGLSSMGSAIAQTAGSAALEMQKSQLEQQRDVLLNQLTAEREHTGRVEQGQIQGGLQQQQQAAALTQAQFQEGEATKRTGLEQTGANARAQTQAQAELGSAKISANAPPSEVKEATWLATATPAQKQAYNEATLIKAGIPPSLMGIETGTSAAGGSGTSPAPSNAAPPKDGTPPASNGNDQGQKKAEDIQMPGDVTGSGPTNTVDSHYNEKALDGLPSSLSSTVKQMVDGRMQPPSSFALSKPYWQAIMAKASEYDPTFDQASWFSRVATRKDFTAGKSAQAVTAMNTAMGHAGRLVDNLDKLDNFGGSLTLLNGPVNFVQGTALGDPRQTNAQMDVSALASEARKVFAASGGGNLTELETWEKNFPYNGSPAQQKGALGEFSGLLESRLESLSDQYNRGMGRTEDPMNLLAPHAQQVFQDLTGRTPQGAIGYQTGKPPAGQATPAGGNNPGRAAAIPGPAINRDDAIQEAVRRGLGKIGPNGQLILNQQ